MKQQFEFLNIMRGFAIIAVVYIHASCLFLNEHTNGLFTLFSFISRFSVPLFIMIAGFLHAAIPPNNRISKWPFFSLLKKKFTRLMVPYLIFSFIYLVVRIALENNSFTKSMIPVKYSDLQSFLSAIFLVNKNPAGQLYYLPLLFFIIIAFSFIEYIMQRRLSGILAVCILLNVISYILWGDIYLSLNPLKGIGFYSLGYIFYFLIIEKQKIVVSTMYISFLIFSLGIAFIYLRFSQTTTSLMVHAGGAIFFFCISILIYNFKWFFFITNVLYKVGKASFTIYLFHEPYIVTLSYIILSKIIGFSPLLSFAITFFIGIVVPITIEYLIFKRWGFLKKILLGASKA